MLTLGLIRPKTILGLTDSISKGFGFFNSYIRGLGLGLGLQVIM